MVIFVNMQVLSFLSRTHLGIRMGPGAVEEAKDTIMRGVQCLNALLLAPKSDCVQINRREKRVEK